MIEELENFFRLFYRLIKDDKLYEDMSQYIKKHFSECFKIDISISDLDIKKNQDKKVKKKKSSTVEEYIDNNDNKDKTSKKNKFINKKRSRDNKTKQKRTNNIDIKIEENKEAEKLEKEKDIEIDIKQEEIECSEDMNKTLKISKQEHEDSQVSHKNLKKENNKSDIENDHENEKITNKTIKIRRKISDSELKASLPDNKKIKKAVERRKKITKEMKSPKNIRGVVLRNEIKNSSSPITKINKPEIDEKPPKGERTKISPSKSPQSKSPNFSKILIEEKETSSSKSRSVSASPDKKQNSFHNLTPKFKNENKTVELNLSLRNRLTNQNLNSSSLENSGITCFSPHKNSSFSPKVKNSAISPRSNKKPKTDSKSYASPTTPPRNLRNNRSSSPLKNIISSSSPIYSPSKKERYKNSYNKKVSSLEISQDTVAKNSRSRSNSSLKNYSDSLQKKKIADNVKSPSKFNITPLKNTFKSKSPKKSTDIEIDIFSLSSPKGTINKRYNKNNSLSKKSPTPRSSKSKSKKSSEKKKNEFLNRKRIRFQNENDIAEFDPNTPVKTIPKSPLKKDFSDVKARGILHNKQDDLIIKSNTKISIQSKKNIKINTELNSKLTYNTKINNISSNSKPTIVEKRITRSSGNIKARISTRLNKK